MPTYEYKCLECQSISEILRSIANRDTPYTCPDCGSTETQKVVSMFAAQVTGYSFKGSGSRDLDRVIGATSERRWDEIHREDAKKAAVRQQAGQHAIGRTPDGQYVPVPQVQMDRRQAAYDKFDYARKTGIKVEH